MLIVTSTQFGLDCTVLKVSIHRLLSRKNLLIRQGKEQFATVYMYIPEIEDFQIELRIINPADLRITSLFVQVETGVCPA